MRRADDPDYCVAVVGAGIMGQGIAQVAIMGRMRTLLYDAKEGAAESAREAVTKRLHRLVEKERLKSSDADDTLARLEIVSKIDDLSPVDTVIEAVFEDLDIKTDVLRSVEARTSESCIIASNTSSIPIAALARNSKRKERIAGMHFFNPVPLMKLVEIVRGPETGPEIIEILSALARRLGRTPVTVKDAPGFLVNMGGRAYTTEALRIAHEGVASPAEIDAIMRDCCHFPMGPFELMDLTGIDVNFPVTQIVYDGYMHDPRIKTSPLHRQLFDAGHFGRKTGQGHYRYDASGQMMDPPSPDFETEASPAARVSLAEEDPGLRTFCEKLKLTVSEGATEGIPILAAPLGDDCTHIAVRTGADPKRLVGIDLTGDHAERVTLMTPPGSDPAILAAVAAAVRASGRKATVIKDSPGFVAQRLRAVIASLGCYMAEVGLAGPRDIDLALKLGLNYPLGPLEIAEDLGLRTTLLIMTRLQDITGDDRYRPSLWLKRRALLDLPIDVPA